MAQGHARSFIRSRGTASQGLQRACAHDARENEGTRWHENGRCFHKSGVLAKVVTGNSDHSNAITFIPLIPSSLSDNKITFHKQANIQQSSLSAIILGQPHLPATTFAKSHFCYNNVDFWHYQTPT
jgi:hypothetical protein